MKLFYSTISLLFIASVLTGQISQASLGSQYSTQEFVNLETGESASVSNEAWDLAFTAIGFQDAGIVLNESASLNGAEQALFMAPTLDFDEVLFEDFFNSSDAGAERLFNSEKSWEFGAFNNPADVNNPLDYGWGSYNPSSMSVVGNRVFVLKLKSGVYKKIMIEDLALTTYTIKYANLDGTDENTASFDKLAFPNSELVYFSFETNAFFTLVDFDWHLVFTRYSTPIDDMEGGLLDYVTTGVLSGYQVEVAKATGIDPISVSSLDYQDAYSTSIDAIGFDWKAFDLGALSWSVSDDRAYFVKIPNGDIYKLVFLDFEGSSTGVVTFESTLVTTTDIEELDEDLGFQLTTYPNPATNDISINLLGINKPGQAKLSIVSSMGQVLKQQQIQVNQGDNQIQIDLDYPTGSYYLKLQMDQYQKVLSIVKQ